MILLPATSWDARSLATGLRASDVQECAFAQGAFGGCARTHEQQVMDSVEKSEAWTLWDGPDLVAIMGVMGMPEDAGAICPADPATCCSIWMMGTDLADTRWRGMTRAARRFKAMQARRWSAMGNIVPAHMRKRLRWLAHLGFDISDPQAQLRQIGYVVFWSHPTDGPTIAPAAP